jgi:hypothetical protein
MAATAKISEAMRRERIQGIVELPYKVLEGKEYVSEYKSSSLMAARVYWHEVPSRFRATEGDVRGCAGAQDSKWLARKLRTYGCGRAVVFRDEFFLRCQDRLGTNGLFCKSHTASAIKDGYLEQGDADR